MTDASESPQPSQPGNAPVNAGQWEPLDPAVIGYWRLSNFFGLGILLGIFAIFSIVMFFALPAARVPLGIVWCLGLIFYAYRIFIYPARDYRAWGYRLDGKVLEIKYGILRRCLVLLPLSRLQHVDVQQGFFERFFKIATLHFHTAGTLHSRISLPGLPEKQAVAIRDALMEKGGDDGV